MAICVCVLFAIEQAGLRDDRFVVVAIRRCRPTTVMSLGRVSWSTLAEIGSVELH